MIYDSNGKSYFLLTCDLVTYACDEIETIFIIPRGSWNDLFHEFINYLYADVPQNRPILPPPFPPSSPPSQYGYYVVLQKILRKYCFLVWVLWHFFHWKIFGKKYGMMLFSEFYLIQCIKILMQHVIKCKKKWDILYYFHTKSSKSSLYFALNSVCQFEVIIFPVLNSCIWLVAPLLDSTDFEDSM